MNVLGVTRSVQIDYLVVDTPPGTSDEHISIVQYLLQTTTINGVIVITTPQEVTQHTICM